MKALRVSRTLRFSVEGWELITNRAKERLGLKNGRVQRARYLEILALGEARASESGESRKQ